MDTDLENYKFDEVDKVLGLVKNLAKCDEELTSKVISDADEYLRNQENKKSFSKTFMNKTSTDATQTQNVDVAAFMSAVERDAAERADRRKKQRVRAEKLKNKANVFFKAGDWQRAVELYTQAIDLAKDWEILYTNRAQASLRLGDAAAALADCDAAVFLLDRQSTSSDDSCAANGARPRVEPNAQLAKAHLHRGKALMALRRPSEALQAYSDSRVYTPSVPKQTGDQAWPSYLAGYVAQAEAAIDAQLAEAKAQQVFDRTAVKTGLTDCAAGNSPRSGDKASWQLVTRLAQLARGSQPVAYYVAGFRQLTGLFETAPTTVSPRASELVDSGPVTRATPRHQGNASSHSRQKHGARRKQAHNGRATATKATPVSVQTAEAEETLEYLQTLFRMRKGFTLLSREVNLVWSSFESYEKTPLSTVETQSPASSDRASANASVVNGGSCQGGDEQMADTTDRLLVLFNLANYLTNDCPENQRILVEDHGSLVSLALKCLLMDSGLISWVIVQMNGEDCSAVTNRGSGHSETGRVHHKLENLRLSASALLTSLTSHASGRQALLSRFGASQLLDAIAKALADSLNPTASLQTAELIGRLQRATSMRTPGRTSQTPGGAAVTPATAVCCAAQVTKVLEHLTGCPSFLLSARSSTASLQSLLSVIEAAVSASGAGASTSRDQLCGLTTNTSCLTSLLDSLATACHDVKLRVDLLLQTRQPLLRALADCLQRHAGLFTDTNHARLVGSICRLLHNVFVGDLSASVMGGDQPVAELDTGRWPGCPGSLTQSLLAGVGTLLDQPGIGPEIRAVAVALAGRILPVCSADQVINWMGTIQHTHERTAIPRSPKPANESDRCQLLLTILDSCSLPVTGNTKKACPDSPTAGSGPDQSDSSSLSTHLLGGCVRCLAACTQHSLALRYAIGDDRRRVRRLTRLLRVKLQTEQSGPPSGRAPARDEVLAGNVCLVLQHCCDDTPLAEHLQGTSVIYDLLSLIQESNRLDTKRNAAILVGKLAHSSHLHRNELSRLDGWSVLTPFNSWSSRLGLV